MFKSMSSDGHLSGGPSSPSPARHGVSSPGFGSQESSWISLLSAVSRPVSFLQKYLLGRPRDQALPQSGAGWVSGECERSFVEEERDFLRQLDDIMPLTGHPAAHLTYLRCQHHGAAGLLEPADGAGLPWLTADSLRELGIQSEEEMELNLCPQTQAGYFSSARTLLSHVGLGLVPSQEIKASGVKGWMAEVEFPVKSSRVKGRTWWGSLWGGEESPQVRPMSDLSGAEEKTAAARLCPQVNVSNAGTTTAIVQSNSRGGTLGEHAGPADHKNQAANNGGLQTATNTEASTPNQHLSVRDHLSVSDHLSGPGAAAACSEAAAPTPEQDNGYSSLEEEQVHMGQLIVEKLPQCENGVDAKADMEEEGGEEEEVQSNEAGALEGQSEAVLANPQCQNRAIAFIMGCPCSDDDSGPSDGESSEDDDGFDSEGSSDLSDSSDEEDDEEDEDSEADSESERLWTSLCRTTDPYNPRNFTARLQTSCTPPRTIPASSPPSSTQSTPASSPSPSSLPLALHVAPPLASSSPPSGSDTWDESTSASEVDEAESLRLWSSFSCSSDPYSPLNFQATIRTAGSRTKTRLRKTSQIPPRSPHRRLASPPEYRREEAEERLDSGFSELCRNKKVRFCDDVEEFFASCGEEEEDRRGPWEELARDRCRFLRRCQEVEESIAYCLQPQHRSLVYQRLSELCGQEA